MGYTQTTNLALNKPDAGEDGYAGSVNDNFDIVDGLFAAIGGHDHSGAAGSGSPIDLSLQDGTITQSQLMDSATIGTWWVADLHGVNCQFYSIATYDTYPVFITNASLTNIQSNTASFTAGTWGSVNMSQANIALATITYGSISRIFCPGSVNITQATLGSVCTYPYLWLNVGGAARPAAAAAHRGGLFYTRNAAGTADTLHVCLLTAGGSYEWATLA